MDVSLPSQTGEASRPVKADNVQSQYYEAP